MEISWLIERLDNPALLQKGDEQRLRELIASYPYFSAPYLLLARSLHEQKHPAFEQLLPLISLQAFDRKRLFKLIHEEVEVKVKVEDEESTVNGRQSTEEEAQNEMVRHPEQANELSDIEESSLRVEGPGPRFAVNFNEIEKTSEEPAQTVHEELQEIPFLLTIDHGPWTIAEEETRGRGDLETGRLGDRGKDMAETLDEEMRGLGDEEEKRLGDEETWRLGDEENDKPETLDEGMRGLGDEEEKRLGDEETWRLGDEENDKPETLDEGMRGLGDEEEKRLGDEETGRLGDEENDKPETLDEGMRGLGDEEEVRRGDEETGDSPNHKSQITNHKSDRIDFIHWLEKLQPVKKIEEVRGLGDEETGRLGDLETRRLGDEEDEMVRHLSEEPVLSLPKESATGMTKTDSLQPVAYSLQPEPDPNALIDKFIETNPSVSRVKERFYDPAVQARESERLDDNLMTETLARIFVKQEKYERAIDAYRKLQLKYPEKSDYFAALILEINSKIN